MFNNLGLGIRLNLEDNVSRRIDPIERELRDLERTARSATGAFNEFADATERRRIRAGQFQDMNSAMRGTEHVLGNVTTRLIRATRAAGEFATATTRMAATGNFNRMLSDITRAQRQIGMMGFGMSRLQREMSDTRAFNTMNYQMKELQDRIALTRRGLEQMQNAPDSSRFVREMADARRALALYEERLRGVNQQQRLAQAYGMRTVSGMGTTILVNPADSLRSAAANRIYGASMMDVARASNLAYQSVSRTGQIMLGTGYTTEEARQRLTQLTGALTMTGIAMTQFVTVPTALAVAGIGLLVTKWEEASNKMQARTLMPSSLIGQSSNMLRDISVGTGMKQEDTGNAMTYAYDNYSNQGMGAVRKQTENALYMQKAFGIGPNKSILDTKKIMQDFGVSSERAWDMYVTGAKKAEKSGDVSKVMDMLGKNGASSDGAYNKMVENLQRGFGVSFIRMIRQAGSAVISFFAPALAALVPLMDRVTGALERMTSFFRDDSNKTFVTTLGFMALGLMGLLALAGPIFLLTGGLVMFRNIIQGVGHAIFGLSRGGLAVLSPMAAMAARNTRGMIAAFARFPQTLLTIIPLLYTFVRGLPGMLVTMMRMNPLFTILSLGLAAYMSNFGGLKDSINSGVASMMNSWTKMVDMYKNSSLPAMFSELADRAKAFADGFMEGLASIVDIGKIVLDTILTPFRAIFRELTPVILDAFNALDKFFGGAGNATSTKDIAERLFGSVDKWRDMGVIAGKVVALLGGFILLTKGLGFISPFQRLSTVLGGIAGKLFAIGTAMRTLPALAGAGAAGIRNGVTGAVGAAGAGVRQAGQYLWNNPNPSTNGTPGLAQRAGSMAMAPYNLTRTAVASVLATMGVGNGVAVGRQMLSMNASGNALRSANPALLSTLNGATLAGGARAFPGLTGTGLYQGRRVMTSNQGALSRALLGQQMYTYNPVRNAAGQITGYQRNNFARTGGLLRRASADGIQNRGNLLQRGFNGTSAFAGAQASRAMSALTNSVLGQATAGVRGRVTGAYRGAMGAGARGFDRVTGSRLAQGLGGAGRWAGGRLAMAGVRNPFAGMLSPTGAAGPMTRMQMARNFATTGVRGGMSMMSSAAMMAGSAAMGGARTVGRGVGAVGRGVGAVGRGVGRVATAPMRGLGRLAGGAMAMAMNPAVLAAGLIGYAGFKAFGGEKKDKDGNITKKGSVHNVAGNMDKTAKNLLAGGDKQITAFWSKFFKVATPIIKSTGRLLVAAIVAVGRAVPGMMRGIGRGLLAIGRFIREGARQGWKWLQTDGGNTFKTIGRAILAALKSAFSGIRSTAKAAWNWMKTDGVTVLKGVWTALKAGASAALSGIKSLAKAAWNWIKTDGITALKGIWENLKSAGAAAWSALRSAGAKAWNWIKTDGIRLLGQFFAWLLGTALPKAVSLLLSGFSKAFAWIVTDGIALLGSLFAWLVTVAVPQAAQLLWKGLVAAWGWIKDDGIKMLGELLVSFGTFAVDMGAALWDGITSALSGLGSFIMGLIPSAGTIADAVGGFFTGGGGGGGSKKHARGGLFTAPHVGMVGEAGPEVIIPLSGNMRSLAKNYLKQTAGVLGYDLQEQGASKSASAPILSRNAPVRTASGGGGKAQAQHTDNSLKVDNFIVQLPESMAGIGEKQAKLQGKLILKELQKELKIQRGRGGKNLTLNDLVDNM